MYKDQRLLAQQGGFPQKDYPFQHLVSVGGYDFPEPTEYSGNTATLVDSGRNIQGKMIGAVIRDDVAKVILKWNYLTVEEWARVNSCFKESAGGSFINSVTFFDQTTGNYETREMYVSDRKADMWRRDPNTGIILGWVGCALSLIEV